MYETPGIYYERLDTAPRPVTVARMDVLGIVGIARRGPIDRPVLVTSFRQFETHFGSFTGAGYLAYALKAFFDNGGERAWVVRIADRDPSRGAAPAFLDIRVPAIPGHAISELCWRISASSAGSWGNDLEILLIPGARVVVTSSPLDVDGRALRVPTTAGFARDSLLRLSQDGVIEYRVLAAVDSSRGVLHLVHPDPDKQRPSDRPATPLDPLRPIRIEVLEWSLAVREAGRLVGLIEELSIVPDHSRFGPVVLAVPHYPVEAETETPPAPPFSVAITVQPTVTAGAVPLDVAGPTARPLSGGRDGLSALSITDFIGAPIPVREGPDAPRRGLQALDRLREPAIIAVPDICIRPEPDPEIEPLPFVPPDPCDPCPTGDAPAPLRTRARMDIPPTFSEAEIAVVQQHLVEDCERHRDRIALLDPPWPSIASPAMGVTGLEVWRSQFDSRHAAVYAPWITVVDPRRPDVIRYVPPSGHVAGQYALSDTLEGVHRAPANRDLAWAEGVSLAIDDARHGLVNRMGINVIRTSLGRRLRILGARTVSSDPDARYVPVRRLIMLLLRSFEQVTAWAVMEPNNADTRASLAQSAGDLMRLLWEQGAFAGDTPDDAYAVRCDETNNTPADRDAGRLACDLAIAPVIPYEFVVLRLGRIGGVIEVKEQAVKLSGAQP